MLRGLRALGGTSLLVLHDESEYSRDHLESFSGSVGLYPFLEETLYHLPSAFECANTGSRDADRNRRRFGCRQIARLNAAHEGSLHMIVLLWKMNLAYKTLFFIIMPPLFAFERKRAFWYRWTVGFVVECIGIMTRWLYHTTKRFIFVDGT